MASIYIPRILLGVPIMAFGIWMLMRPERFVVRRDRRSWFDYVLIFPLLAQSKLYMRVTGVFFLLIGFVQMDCVLAGVERAGCPPLNEIVSDPCGTQP